jgi:rubrerythrin
MTEEQLLVHIAHIADGNEGSDIDANRHAIVEEFSQLRARIAGAETRYAQAALAIVDVTLNWHNEKTKNKELSRALKETKESVSEKRLQSLIDAWHESKTSKPLHTWLGMTAEEYKDWLGGGSWRMRMEEAEKKFDTLLKQHTPEDTHCPYCEEVIAEPEDFFGDTIYEDDEREVDCPHCGKPFILACTDCTCTFNFSATKYDEKAQ